METAAGFIRRYLLDGLDPAEPDCNTDYKTALQEKVQRHSGQSLAYVLTGERGPDHAKTFCVQVLLNGEALGQGEGHTKKEAEQAAARCALGRLP